MSDNLKAMGDHPAFGVLISRLEGDGIEVGTLQGYQTVTLFDDLATSGGMDGKS